jgi:hypothetical protein
MNLFFIVISLRDEAATIADAIGDIVLAPVWAVVRPYLYSCAISSVVVA